MLGVREILEESRDSEYFSKNGLITMTGLPENRWVVVIVKEPVDNSLDAIEDLADKQIEVCYRDNLLSIHDSFNGIPEDELDKIFDFSKYASSKRAFRTVSRGYQGNALKTVIAICHICNYDLYFVTANRKISYELDKVKLKIGIVSFNKQAEHTTLRSGVYFDRIEIEESVIKRILFINCLVNPDVTFKYNGGEINWQRIS